MSERQVRAQLESLQLLNGADDYSLIQSLLVGKIVQNHMHHSLIVLLMKEIS